MRHPAYSPHQWLYRSLTIIAAALLAVSAPSLIHADPVAIADPSFEEEIVDGEYTGPWEIIGNPYFPSKVEAINQNYFPGAVGADGAQYLKARPNGPGGAQQSIPGEIISEGTVYQLTFSIGYRLDSTKFLGVGAELIAETGGGDQVLFQKSFCANNVAQNGQFADVSMIYQIQGTDPQGAQLKIKLYQNGNNTDVYIDNVRLEKQSGSTGVVDPSLLASPSFEGPKGNYGWSSAYGSGFTSGQGGLLGAATDIYTCGTQSWKFNQQNNGNQNEYSVTGFRIVPGTYTLTADGIENWQNDTPGVNNSYVGQFKVQLMANGYPFAESTVEALNDRGQGIAGWKTATMTYMVDDSRTDLIGAFLGVNLRVDGLPGGVGNAIHDNVRLIVTPAGSSDTQVIISLDDGCSTTVNPCDAFTPSTATAFDAMTGEDLTESIVVYQDPQNDPQLTVTTVDGVDYYTAPTPGVYHIFYDVPDNNVPPNIIASQMLTVTVTDIVVSFPQGLIVTGYTLPVNESTIKRSIIINVSPAENADDIEFTVEGNGASRASIQNIVANAETGIVTMNVYGREATPSTEENGDTIIVAHCGTPDGPILASASVTVVIPAEIDDDPALSWIQNVPGKNVALNETTVSFLLVAQHKVKLVTQYGRSIDVSVVDQFGNLLNDLYNTQAIYELLGGQWRDINVTLVDGVYSDWVGFLATKKDDTLPPTPAGSDSIVDKGSTEETQWIESPQVELIGGSTPPVTQYIGVRIGGHILNPSVVNRRLSYVHEPQPTLIIE